jgi:hypothetical protein
MSLKVNQYETIKSDYMCDQFSEDSRVENI